MKIRTGCDLVSMARFEKMLETSPNLLERVFLPSEQSSTIKADDQNRLAHLAGIFAAKEAVMKALGIAAGEWQNIEISYEQNGRPKVHLGQVGVSNNALPNQSRAPEIDVSISHAGGFALAVAVVAVH